MADEHIFRASGDSCPICTALDGETVSEGYQPHDGCMCQTIPKDQDGDCTWEFEHTGNMRDGSGHLDVISSFEVTVICPDGSVVGASGQFDGHPFSDFDDWVESFHEAAEEMATEICASCPPVKPFLCC